MKKLVCLAVVAMMFSFNANAEEEFVGSCTQDAWDHGTDMGGGDPAMEFYFTDKYFRENCA